MADPTTAKQQLQIRLLVAGSVFELAMSAATAFESGDGEALAATEALTRHSPCARDLVRDKRLLPEVIDFYRKMQMRGLITFVYDLIMGYCDATNQQAAFEAAPWYWHARIIRNCLSHDSVIRYKAAAIREALPVEWNGRAFDESMDGEPVSMGHFDLAAVVELFNACVEFAAELTDGQKPGA